MSKLALWTIIIAVIIITLLLYMNKNQNKPKNNMNDFAVVEISIQDSSSFLLYILMHSDGTYNRSGNVNDSLTAKLDNNPVKTYMGQSDSKMLEEMLNSLSVEFAEKKGDHDLGGSGRPITLTINIQVGERGLNFKYIYGSETSGPPPIIKDYVKKAITLTDQWIENI